MSSPPPANPAVSALAASRTMLIGTTVVCALLFVLLAVSVFGTHWFTKVDFAIALSLRRHPIDYGLYRFFWRVTHLCDRETVLTLTMLLVAFSVVSRRGSLQVAFLTMEASVAAVVEMGLKGYFERLRPFGMLEKLHLAGYAFPSGHSMLSVCYYGLLLYFVACWAPVAARKWIAALAVAIVILVGSSRVIVGAHYFSDVLGGYLVALPMLAAGIHAYQSMRFRHGHG